MAFTRYNQGAQYSPANTYVPIPFDELLTAGMLRDRQYAENQAAQDSFYTGLRDMDVHAADQPLYQRKIADLNNQLQTLQKNNPDIGSYDFKRNLDEVVSTQSRDPLWRAMKYNAAKARELEKAYNKAKSEGNTPANLVDMEDALQRFYKQGSEGVGFLGDLSPYKFVDYIDPLEKRGQNFIKEGNLQGLYNPDFTLKTTTGREGVPVSEVAAVYGYKYNPSTGLQFVGIPPDFLDSDAGQQMKRDAIYRARQTGEDPNQILQALYQSKTAPLVSKYSGVSTKYDQDLTSLGTSTLERQQYAGDASKFTVPSKHVEMDAQGNIAKRDLEGIVQGWKPSAAGNFMRKATEGAISAWSWLTSNPATQVVAKELAEDIYGDGKKSSPGFKAIERNIKAVNPGLSGRDLQDAVEDEVKSWYKRTTQMPVTIEIDPKRKAQMATTWFGFSADNGIVSGANLNGPAIDQQIFDPSNPTSTATLGEIADKNSTIEYVGPLKNNNLYKPGLHEIKINQKTYYMSGLNQEEEQKRFDWQLYDHGRHPDGIGNWYPLAGTNKDFRSVKWINPNTKREEVFFQIKGENDPDSKAKSTTVVPAGADLFTHFTTKVLPTIK